MESMLTQEQQTALSLFDSELDELSRNPLFRHKHAVVSVNGVTGIFDTPQAALAFALEKHSIGEFVIQQIIKPEEIVSFLYSAA